MGIVDWFRKIFDNDVPPKHIVSLHRFDDLTLQETLCIEEGLRELTNRLANAPYLVYTDQQKDNYRVLVFLLEEISLVNYSRMSQENQMRRDMNGF